ncbi:MAG: hypothetical protein WC007_11165 [Pelobacteraceae bacterium]
MVTYNKHKITSTTSWIAGLVAVAVALLLPLGYFTVSYQYLAGSLEAEAEMTSSLVTGLINSNPELWQYEQIRLEDLLAERMRDNHRETRRILDRQNRVIAESVTPMKPPLLTRRFDLRDAGVPVGTLDICTSLFPLLLHSGFVALLGLTCGAVIFVTLRVLPLRAVNQAEKSLHENERELTIKVAELEDALTKVKQLEGIIPICMYCKKIRDDKESWQQLEGYISEHSEAHFSHGICPECYEKVTSDYLKELEEKKHP